MIKARSAMLAALLCGAAVFIPLHERSRTALPSYAVSRRAMPGDAPPVLAMLMLAKMSMLRGTQAPRTVTLGNFSSTVNTATGASLVINKPTGVVDGDLMIAVMCQSGASSPTWTGDSGWTEVLEQGAQNSIRVAWKVAASEGSNYTFTLSSSSRISGGAIIAFRGAAYDTVGSVVTASGTSDIVASTITSAGGVLLALYSSNQVGDTFTTPAGMSVLTGNLNSVSATTPSLNVFSQVIGSGATGTKTSTPSGSGQHGGVLISVKAA